MRIAFIVLMFAFTAQAQNVGVACTPRTAGVWDKVKQGHQWLFCDPRTNTTTWLRGIFNVDTRQGNVDGLDAAVVSKYGSYHNWAQGESNRLQLYWHFNAIADESSQYVMPFPTFAGTGNNVGVSGSSRAPVTIVLNTSQYGNYDGGSFGHSGYKDILEAAAYGFYNGLIHEGGADVYDPAYAVQVNDFANYYANTMGAASFPNYIIGVACDDLDYMYGFGSGDDIVTSNLSYHPHLGWIAIAASPKMGAGPTRNYTYTDTQVYTKTQMQTYLTNKYVTVGALNTAWGSTYTTLGSSGTTHSAFACGTGNGSTLHFTCTLSPVTGGVSKHSVIVKVGGTVAAGDGWEFTLGKQIYGTNIDYNTNLSTVNYTSGAVSIWFAAGHAPANLAAITIDYDTAGWGIGTGLMDEDGSHTWLGNDGISTFHFGLMPNANATARADLDDFLDTNYADKYFSTNVAKIHANFNSNTLVFGVLSMNGFSGVTRAPILKAAGRNIDVLDASVYTQAAFNFTFSNYGNHPVVSWEGSFANADSDSPACGSQCNGFPAGFTQATQAARGTFMSGRVKSLYAFSDSGTGDRIVAGLKVWAYPSSTGEQLNWGQVDFLDNTFDGLESVTGSVLCQSPIQAYNCGGTASNYGNYMTPFATTMKDIDGSPSVAITAPAVGSYSGSLTITATCSDNVICTTLQFTLDGANLGTAISAAPWQLTIDTGTIINGSHTIAATAQDSVTNSGTAAGVAVSFSNAKTLTGRCPTGCVITH